KIITNINLPENTLKEINKECVTADVDIEDFITFDNKLKTHQTYELASFLEKEEKEEENNDDDDDDSEINDEPKIKDFKTAISYLEELQKFSATISNSNLLELTTKVRECAERAALNHKNQSNIKNYFSKL
ncbi:Hypothetical protein CINCED_3A015074, partial [Cinara cedri]